MKDFNSISYTQAAESDAILATSTNNIEAAKSAADYGFPGVSKHIRALHAWKCAVMSEAVMVPVSLDAKMETVSLLHVSVVPLFEKSDQTPQFEEVSSVSLSERPLQDWQKPAPQTVHFDVRDDVQSFDTLNGRRNVTVSMTNYFKPQN